AIEVFKNNNIIDLVLMDIDLGQGIDGTETAIAMLKLRAVPIVFLSSHTEPAIVEKTEKITSYGYILKNSGPTVLYASIKMAFKLFDSQKLMNERDERLQRAEIMAGFGNWELDLAKKIFYASEGARMIYGLGENELIVEIVQKCPLPQYRAMLDSALRNLIEKNHSYDVVFEIKRQNDQKHAFIHSIARYDAARNCVTGIIHDITERKLVEDALKNSELKYRSLIEHSSDVVFCVDQKGEYKFVNQVFASTFAKTPEYFLGKTFWDIYPKEHADHRQSVSLKVFQTGESQSTEVVVPLKDRTLYFLAKANPIIDDSGKVILNLTHATDITERKQAELMLRAKEERLQNVIAGTNVGTWEWNIQSGETVFNERWAAILGYTLEELQPVDIQTWMRLAHPDDLKKSDELLKKHFQGETEYYVLESRMKHKNGSWVWVFDCGK
ncbi:MAG TPA: PAS domain S-box protein, partial [Candidatus Wallbacteria bacterium]|nr:PAS domain S-box protein [Candidatus Wallbacteria bacterium]